MATPLPDYLAAREAHETRWDRLATGKRNWQIVATILLALDVFLTVAFIQSARRSSVVPYVVEVDHHGNALSVGPAAALHLPDTLLWRYVLVGFHPQPADGPRRFRGAQSSPSGCGGVLTGQCGFDGSPVV